MSVVASTDGTTIAYERRGGALLIWWLRCARASPVVEIAPLPQHFTVFTYDRRGAGRAAMPGNMLHRVRWTTSRR